jgi:soluble cytochrome b562
MKIKVQQDYKTLRGKSYPPIAEQLDAIWKVLQSGKIADAKDMVDKINAVKTKYPKK